MPLSRIGANGRESSEARSTAYHLTRELSVGQSWRAVEGFDCSNIQNEAARRRADPHADPDGAMGKLLCLPVILREPALAVGKPASRPDWWLRAGGTTGWKPDPTDLVTAIRLCCVDKRHKPTTSFSTSKPKASPAAVFDRRADELMQMQISAGELPVIGGCRKKPSVAEIWWRNGGLTRAFVLAWTRAYLFSQ